MTPNAFNSGSTFYSETNPENVKRVEPTAAEPARASIPENPPYNRYTDSGAESFAPSGETADPSFRPAHVEIAPPMFSLPLIGLGLFALWVLFKGDRQ